MKAFEFQDKYGTELKVQHSSSVSESYWIYLKSKDLPEPIDSASGEPIPFALHLSRRQAEILISALQDLFDDSDLI